MELPFINGTARKKRNQVMAVDLGARTTKAVLMERRGEVLALSRYALLDAPIFDKKYFHRISLRASPQRGRSAGRWDSMCDAGGRP